MRAGRIARLMNEPDFEAIFRYEVGGYPPGEHGLDAETWRLAGIANRYFMQLNSKTNKSERFAYLESIETIAESVKSGRERLAVSGDRESDQRVMGNAFERMALTSAIETNVRRLSARRALLYDYLFSRYHQLRYSGITADAFTRLRTGVDTRIAQHVPVAVQQFDSVYANLQSENPEDWANAVHSCRRILENLADSLFPASSERVKDGKTIKLGPKNYKNRLLCYAEDRSGSGTFNAVVGSTLAFLEDRLDALFDAANKGTHAGISKNDADRYVIYTYLVIGDILSL